VPTPLHLLARPSGLFFRLAVPMPLRALLGCREVVRKLPAVDRTRARYVCTILAYRLLRLFANRGEAMMSASKFKDIVDRWLQEALAEDEAMRATARPQPQGHLDAIEFLRDDYRVALADNDLTVVRGHVEELVEREGLTLDAQERRTLSRALLKAAADLLTVQVARGRGDYQTERQLFPKGPSGTPTTPKPPGVRLSTAVARFLDDKSATTWNREKTRVAVEDSLQLFQEIVGDVDLSRVNHETARTYTDAIRRLPANRSKLPRYRGLSVQQILKLPDVTSWSPGTVRNHADRVSFFAEWCVKQGYMARNYFEGAIRFKKTKRQDEERDAYTAADLQRIFSAPLYAEHRYKHAYQWWLPVLALSSGCRLNETCQLHLEDIKEVEGHLCIEVTDAGERRVKNVASRRIIPLHTTILQIGFPAFVDSQRAAGHVRLFPELPKGRDGYSQDASKWYARFRRTLRLGREFDGRKLDFHSFRATTAVLLQDAGVPYETIADLMGHAKPGETQRYAGRLKVPRLAEAVNKMDLQVLQGLTWEPTSPSRPHPAKPSSR
jgi:integrase